MEAYRAAIDLLSEAVRINPRAAVAYGFLAHGYAQLGESSHAVEAARQALANAPSDLEVRATVATAYVAIGMTHEASRLVEQLLSDGYSEKRLLSNVGLKTLAKGLLNN